MDQKVLQSYQSLLQEIALLEKEKQELSERKLGAICLNGLPRGKGTCDITGEIAGKLVDLSDEIAKKLNAAISLRLEIEKTITSLDAQDRVLMRLRYIEGLAWEEVAIRMNYNYRWVIKLHRRILEEIGPKKTLCSVL